MELTETAQARLRAAIVAIAPAVLLAGFVYHPYFENVTDPEAIAAAVAADTTRWGIAHLTIAVGYGLAILAFLAIRSYLHVAGENRWSLLALPFVVMGSSLFIVLTGIEFVPLAAAETAADTAAAQDAVRPWFLPVFLTGAVSFTLGALGFALAIVRSGVLHPRLAWLVAGALTVMAAARFIPLAAGPLVVSVAGVVALWPLAYTMWKNLETRPVEESRLRPAI